MTLEEAQQLAWSANQPHSNLFIEWAKVQQEPDGSYSLVVEPVEGEQQIFADAEKAHWALVEWLAKASRANDRYFTLNEDGSVREIDFETWKSDWATREKTQTKIKCSSEIEATISFSGHAWSIVHMDEDLKLWSAGFCITAKNEHYGGIPFRTLEEAKAFVDQYKAKGCPPSGFPFMQFLAEFKRDNPGL
jgi:hypothetical protein